MIIDRQPLSESDMQEGGEGVKTCELSVGSTSQSDRCRKGPHVDPAIKLLDEKVSGREKVYIFHTSHLMSLWSTVLNNFDFFS